MNVCLAEFMYVCIFKGKYGVLLFSLHTVRGCCSHVYVLTECTTEVAVILYFVGKRV